MGDSDSFFNHLEAFLKKWKPNEDFSTIRKKLTDSEVEDLGLLKQLLGKKEEELPNELKFTFGVKLALEAYVEEQGKVQLLLKQLNSDLKVFFVLSR